MQKIKQITLNIAIVLISIIVLVLLYNYMQLKIFHKDYANFCGYTILKVATGSMVDTININDLIIVKITKDVDKGDIITYKKHNELITHRIIKKDGNTIITKGDANNIEDEPITIDNIIGKVVVIIK